jgi:hypothetical protein
VKDATALKALDKVKAERVVSFFTDTINVALKVQKIYKKTQIEGIAIDTEDKSWSLMGNHLYYLHLVLGSKFDIVNCEPSNIGHLTRFFSAVKSR